MKDTKKVAVALIQNEKGEYLFIQQKTKDWGKFTDAWYPPAGHVKNNETIEEGLIRELKEELNLDIKPIEFISTQNQDVNNEVADWWKCKIMGGKIIFNDGTIANYGYFNKEQVKNLKLWPATRKFFEKFIWKDSTYLPTRSEGPSSS